MLGRPRGAALLRRRSAAAARPERRPRPAAGLEGLAVATGAWLCGLVAVAWLLNPYAAGLLVGAAHLWLFAAGGWRARAGLAALAAGLALPVLAIVYLGLALELGPLELAWGGALGAAAGTGMWSAALLGGLLAALAGVVRVLFARRRNAARGRRRCARSARAGR